MKLMLLIAVGMLAMMPVEAAQYSTEPPVGTAAGFSLSLTAHPGLCEHDNANCTSTQARVYEWPVDHGDRIVIEPNTGTSPSSAIARLGHIYLPVDLDTPLAGEAVTIEVALHPATRLRILQAGSQSSLDVVAGRWFAVPLADTTRRLYLRLNAPREDSLGPDSAPN